MADGRHFEKSLYLYISAANRPNMTKFGMQMHILSLTQATEMWENFRNSQIQDGRRTPYWRSFFGYNSAPYCLIKTKFGMRRHNCTHTKVSWWKRSNLGNSTWRTAAILKISPYLSRELSEFDEIWYAEANFDQGDGNMTKIHKFAYSKWRMDAALKIIFGYNWAVYCPIKMKFGVRSRITCIRSRSGDKNA